MNKRRRVAARTCAPMTIFGPCDQSRQMGHGETASRRREDVGILRPEYGHRTGDGRCEITVNPFSRSHDSIQIADNPKTLFASREPLELAGAQVLTVAADVGAASHGANVHDIWDAFVTLNLFDFESGIVLDFLLNGQRIYALYERLYMPGVTSEETAFTREANLTVNSRPGQMHRCAFVYDRAGIPRSGAWKENSLAAS